MTSLIHLQMSIRHHRCYDLIKATVVKYLATCFLKAIGNMERLISKDHPQQNAITFPCMYLQRRKREMLAKCQKNLFMEVAEVTKTVFTGPSLEN